MDLWIFGENSFNPKVEEIKSGTGIVCPICGVHGDNGRRLIRDCTDERVRKVVKEANEALQEAESPVGRLVDCIDRGDCEIPWSIVLCALSELWALRREARLA